MSGHKRKTTEQGTLTSWRWPREGLVRTQKKADRARRTYMLETGREGFVRIHKVTDQARRTHQLETAEWETCQDTERNRTSEAHSHPGDDRGTGLSGHRKKPTEQGALTNWRQQSERLVRIRKETDRARPTHVLETAEGGTCHDTERTRPSKAHPHPGDGTGKDLSGHRKKPIERET